MTHLLIYQTPKGKEAIIQPQDKKDRGEKGGFSQLTNYQIVPYQQ